MVLVAVRAWGLGARTRNGQLGDVSGEVTCPELRVARELTVCTTPLISPRSGAGISTTVSLARRSLGGVGEQPGCCGIVGPGPSATLDKTSLPPRSGAGKTESMYFD